VQPCAAADKKFAGMDSKFAALADDIADMRKDMATKEQLFALLTLGFGDGASIGRRRPLSRKLLERRTAHPRQVTQTQAPQALSRRPTR